MIEVIRKSKNLLLKQIKENNIDFQIDITETKLVYGVNTEFEQVVLNLINNSIDAFNDRKIENRIIKIGATSNQKKTILTFEDNAGGIDNSNIDDIFDPYYTTKETGTGTGLYVVKLVVKSSFKGELKVEDSEIGLKYTITLPTTEML
ncbi:MAG: Sporulation kinase E [Arcobacter lacus]|nr:MAG: Sporulation kinase E [Arcobacter lacus]